MADGTQFAPRTEYARRLEERRRTEAHFTRWDQVLDNARVVLFPAAAALAWFAFGARTVSPFWLGVPLALFVAVSIALDRVSATRRRARRAVAFYENGLARIEHRWAGRGERGERFLDVAHPNAADLDLFGMGSVFELLCQARTRVGQDALAGWLLAPSDPGPIRQRQAAVAELRPLLDLREDLDVLGAHVRDVANPEGLAAWGSRPPVANPRTPRVLALALAASALATMALWLFTDVGHLPFLIVATAEMSFWLWLRERCERMVAGVDRKAGDLAVVAALMSRLERERFQAPRLRELRAALDVAGLPPSARVAQLARIVERLNWRNNQLFGTLAAIVLWGTQHALALESWRIVSGPAISRWLAVVGEFEALGAFAAYSYENPADPFPEIVAEGPCFEGAGIGHPLLPPEQCVRNDLQLGGPLRLLVVSGSNMSGKSTLLRTVGVNTVLGLAGAPVRARRLRLSPMVVGATLRIQDSLQEGRSRFYAEITRIRQLAGLAPGPPPLLFLLDEILQGTNSHDRRLGAEAVIRSLIARGAIGLVTTHDLALTRIADLLGDAGANVHFEDRFENGSITFDYHMRPGVVQKSNALALMRSIGLDVPLTPEHDGQPRAN